MEAVDLLAQVSAGKQGGDRKSENIKVNNINVDSDRPMGTSTGYTMRRLAKDFPMIHAEVIFNNVSDSAAWAGR